MTVTKRNEEIMLNEIIQQSQYKGYDLVLETHGWFYGTRGLCMTGPFQTKDECVEEINGKGAGS